MKPIKLLFIISFLAFATSIQSQNIIDNTRFLYLTFNNNTGGEKVSIEKIQKINPLSNRYTFNTETIAENNNLIYYFNGKDSVLYYNYDLNAGDTFFFKRTMGIDTMVVDSVKLILLNDNKAYKHWYLKSLYTSKPIVWVRGLGEKNLAWLRYDLQFINTPKLKAICKNDSLIFWDNSFNGFEPRNVQATCEFDSLLKRNSLTAIDFSSFVVFPNPASNGIQVNGIERGPYKIYNSIGQLQQSGNFENSIQIENLKTGLYFIEIEKKNFILRGSFLKE